MLTVALAMNMLEEMGGRVGRRAELPRENPTFRGVAGATPDAKPGPMTPSSRSSPGDQRPGRRVPLSGLTGTVALGALFALAAAIILHAGRGLLFLADEWDWIQFRSDPGLSSLLDGHNDHWMTVPIAIHQVLYRVVGLEAHFPYRFVVLVAHLAGAFLLFLYMRARIGRLVAFTVTGVFALYGYAARVIVYPASLGWAIAVAAVIGALLLLDRRERTADVGAFLLLLTAGASCSIAVPFMIGVAVELLLRRDRARLWVPSIPLVVYAVWWATFRTMGSSTIKTSGLFDTARFAERVATETVGTLLGIGSRGTTAELALGVVVAGLLVVWLVRGRPRSPRLVGISVASVLLVGALAVGRAGANDVPTWYAYPIAASLLLLVAELFDGAHVATLVARVTVSAVVIVVALWSVWWNVGELESATDTERFVASIHRAQLGVLEVIDRDVPRDFRPLFYGPALTAGRYREIVARYGGFGWPVRRVLEHPNARLREAADHTLVRGVGVSAQPFTGVAAASAPVGMEVLDGEPVDAGCLVVLASPRGRAVADVVARSIDVVIGAELGAATLRLGMFAGPSVKIGAIESGDRARVRVGPLEGAGRWTLRVWSRGTVRLCAAPPASEESLPETQSP